MIFFSSVISQFRFITCVEFASILCLQLWLASPASEDPLKTCITSPKCKQFMKLYTRCRCCLLNAPLLQNVIFNFYITTLFNKSLSRTTLTNRLQNNLPVYNFISNMSFQRLLQSTYTLFGFVLWKQMYQHISKL